MPRALFGFRTGRELLGSFFLKEEKEFYVPELERLTGEDYKSVVLEPNCLKKIGAVRSRKQGNLKYYGLNKDFIVQVMKGLKIFLAGDEEKIRAIGQGRVYQAV